MNHLGWNDEEINIIIDTDITPKTLEDEKEYVFSVLDSSDKHYIYYELDNILDHASNELKNSKDVILAILKADIMFGRLLVYASESLKDDKEVVHAAVISDGISLQYASQRLMNDLDVIFAAVTNNGEVLKIIPDDLKNEILVLAAVTSNGLALEYVPAFLKNKEIVLAAVTNNSIALKYVPESLKNKEIVLAAVTNNGGSLKYAPELLKKDKEVVFTAVKQCGNALEYVDDIFKNDKELAIIAVSDGYPNYFFGMSVKHVSECLKNDMDVVLTAVKYDGYALYYISNKFIKSNFKVVVYAINTSGIKVLSCVPYDDCIVEKTFDQEYEDYYDNFMGHLKNYNPCEHTYHNIYIHIKENIKLHEKFLLLLQGVCVPRSQCVLQKYGYFHSIDFLKLIADFTGIIYGNDYRVYKNVFRQVNLILC